MIYLTFGMAMIFWSDGVFGCLYFDLFDFRDGYDFLVYHSPHSFSKNNKLITLITKIK